MILSTAFLPFILLGKVGSFSATTVTPQVGYKHPNPTKNALFSATSSETTQVDTSEFAERDIQTMEEWAANCGVQRAEGLQLMDSSTSTERMGDWSAFTNQDIPQGSPLLFVPNEMILSSSQIRSELGGVVDLAVQKLNKLGASAEIPSFFLFLKVLREWERGVESPYYPWLNALPRLYYNAVSMTDLCYECLPPLVFSLARTERVKFENIYQALQQVSVLAPETKQNHELAKWAYNVVSTRSFGPDNEKRIVPMADMFNHGTETEIAMQYDDDGHCHVYTTKDVPAGSPLRMSYADPTNPSYLFALYGFLDESSPATFCKLMTKNPMCEDYSRMLFYKDTGDISPEVWDVLLYEVLGRRNDVEVQRALYDAHMNGDVDTKQAIHEQYFGETALVMQNHIDTFLKQLDELSQRADGKDWNQHPRLPLILRHNEFVKTTFLTVKSRLDPMVAAATGEAVYNN